MNWNKYLSSNRLRQSSSISEHDERNEFERDLGRVIFCPAVRRLHDKTQVFPLTNNDNTHSRLTHSLEVMSVGYSIVLKLCQNDMFRQKIGDKSHQTFTRALPFILQTTCLTHDIGNPPFGHFGETVIQNYFKQLFEKNNLDLSLQQQADFCYFDGNAQGFRVLTKLQILDDIYGLNLTYASLGSFLKYPYCGVPDKAILTKKKRGVFLTEELYLQQIAKECDLLKTDGSFMRHPLSFIMEAADSICYLIMDIEDALERKWFEFSFFIHQLEDSSAFAKILQNIENKDNTDKKKMIKIRLQVIERLVDLTVNNYIKHIDEICNGTYSQELIKDDDDQFAQTLDDFCTRYIYCHKEIIDMELTGYSILKGLLDFYMQFFFEQNRQYSDRAAASISQSIVQLAMMEERVQTFEELSAFAKLHCIVDFISGMTDQYALSQYRKISGQQIYS
jgi:dGTPase